MDGTPLRLAAYSDLEFVRRDGQVVTEESFLVFMAELRTAFDALVVVGRLRDDPGAEGTYAVPDDVEFVALPDYPALSRPLDAVRALRGSLRAFAGVVESVDAVWLMGPHPFSIAFALQAWRRGRTVVLGVRQDFPAHMRARHPRAWWLRAAAALLEGAWRLLGRRAPVVTVGGELAQRYRAARRVLPIAVSLVRAAELDGAPPARSGEPPFTVLSVGRIDPEKNPLLLADVLAAVVERGVDARLIVCGTGTDVEALRTRLQSLGVAERAELRGHVGAEELREAYRTSDAFLHVSWTEGVPQVLLEAYAAGLPVVATDVGGVAEHAAGAALLVPPGRTQEPVDALVRLVREPALRAELAERGFERVRSRTLEAEAGRVARFIAEAARG